MSDDTAIAEHIALYGKLMAEQVERVGGWPATFTFPEPASESERQALRLFIQEVKQTTGADVRLASGEKP
jgi:hypothetical protein